MGIIKLMNLYEGETFPNLKIFCDLDGVLTNWFKAFRDLGPEITKGLEGNVYEEKYGREKLWKIIAEHGKLEFWSEMEWMPNGKELWNYVKKYNPTILSTPARNKLSKDGKKIWVARELGENVPIILIKDKWKHADTESILIDDYDKKINDWVNLGDGIGILHTSTEDTIKKLKQFEL
jgi:hypothetical protein